MRLLPTVIAALIFTSSARAEGLQITEPPPELETAYPAWPQEIKDSGWQPPADLVRAAAFTSLDPLRIATECNSGFALAQIAPGSAYDVIKVEGLPSPQYKIETAYYGRWSLGECPGSRRTGPWRCHAWTTAFQACVLSTGGLGFRSWSTGQGIRHGRFLPDDHLLKPRIGAA